MILRFIASIMILAGISGIGFEYASRLGKRRDWYEQFIEFLTLLKQEIRYGHYELFDCLEHVAPGINGFFKNFSLSMMDRLSRADGLGMNKIWDETIKAFDLQLDEYGCHGEDKELLKKPGCFLGSCRMEQQDEQLLCLLEAASQKKAKLSEGLCERQKAIRLLGICAGALIVLILL